MSGLYSHDENKASQNVGIRIQDKKQVAYCQ